MNACFIIGSLDISGGTYVILQHASHLRRLGWKITIVPLFPFDLERLSWHPAIKDFTYLTVEQCRHLRFDVAITTWWKTCYSMAEIQAEHYVYFVQSIETRFYARTDFTIRYLAETTYALPMPVITEARWIESYLKERYNRKVDRVPNGVRKDLYNTEIQPFSERHEGRLRVLVEGPLGVPFKNVEKTLELVRRSSADELWLLTLSELGAYPGVDCVFSRLPIAETARVYRSCDVIVKLSYVEGMFGPPLEMFHCGGTAITYDVSGHDEYIRDGCNAVVVRRGDEQGVVAAINKLKQDARWLRNLKHEALTTAEAWPDWEQSSEQFERALQRAMGQPSTDNETLKRTAAAFFSFYEELERSRPLLLRSQLRASARTHLTARFPRLCSGVRRGLQRLQTLRCAVRGWVGSGASNTPKDGATEALVRDTQDEGAKTRQTDHTA